MEQAILLLALTFFAVQANTFYDGMLDLRSSFDLENEFVELNYDISSRASYYICQFNDSLPAESPDCNYRGDIFKKPVYHLYSNWGCFYWTQPNLLNTSVPRPNVTSCVYNNIALVPCFLIQTPSGPKCYQLDERSPEVLNELRRTFISEAVLKRWLRCTASAERCCSDVMANSKPDNNSCPAIWDAWSCYHPQQAGQMSKEVCPEFAYTNTGPACHHYSQKECFGNATWNQTTDYSTCSITPRLVTRVNVHVACLGVSIALCAPAVLLLACYRKLRVRRLALHRNLLAAILIRNVLVIVSKSVVVMNELTTASGDTVMSRNEFSCKLLASLEKLAASAVFTCMLIDGVFLHRSIVAVFKKQLNIKLVFALGAAATFIPVIIWISLMATMNDSNCWIVYTTTGIQWVLDGPRIAMLALNTLLLFDILRIILTKLRRSENSNNLSTTKATLFLMPLFGVQFLLTAWRPTTTSCEGEQAYYFITYVMDGLQGIMVAILYCYYNKEVHTLIKITYKKTETVVSTRFRIDPNGRRATVHKKDGRRDTFTTMVDNKQNQEDEDILETNPQLAALEPTIIPSLLDSGIDEEINPKTEENISPEDNLENVNSLTILNDAYSPSDDGFVHLDFEHDEAPNPTTPDRPVLEIPRYSSEQNDFPDTYDNLRFDRIESRNPFSDVWADNPAYEEDVSNINTVIYENVNFANKPRTIFDDSEKLTNDSSNFTDESNDCKQRVIPNQRSEDLLKIPDTRDYETEVTPQDQTPNTYLKNEDIKNNNYSFDATQPNEKRPQTDIPDEATKCDSSSFADYSLPTNIIENIDALGIYEDIYRSNISKTGEAIDNDWDDVIMDPSKFCPNRSKDDIIYFK